MSYLDLDPPAFDETTIGGYDNNENAFVDSD
jgi:hypothetical protein